MLVEREDGVEGVVTRDAEEEKVEMVSDVVIVVVDSDTLDTASDVCRTRRWEFLNSHKAVWATGAIHREEGVRRKGRPS